MWEIFTCGRVPYAGVNVLSLLNVLKRGERLEKPDNQACHDDMLGFCNTLTFSTPFISPKLTRELCTKY